MRGRQDIVEIHHVTGVNCTTPAHIAAYIQQHILIRQREVGFGTYQFWCHFFVFALSFLPFSLSPHFFLLHTDVGNSFEAASKNIFKSHHFVVCILITECLYYHPCQSHILHSWHCEKLGRSNRNFIPRNSTQVSAQRVDMVWHCNNRQKKKWGEKTKNKKNNSNNNIANIEACKMMKVTRKR